MASEDSGLEGNVDVIRCSRSSCCILHESCKRSYEADLRAGRRERHLHFGSSRLRVAAVGRVTTGSSSSSPTQPPLSVPPEPLRPTLPVAASRSGPASACVCPPSHTLGPRRLLLVGRPPSSASLALNRSCRAELLRRTPTAGARSASPVRPFPGVALARPPPPGGCETEVEPAADPCPHSPSSLPVVPTVPASLHCPESSAHAPARRQWSLPTRSQSAMCSGSLTRSPSSRSTASRP